MAKLPEEIVVSPTVTAIYAAYKAKEEKRLSRRLGASVIGQECPRRVWYGFRWASEEDFDGRILRLFNTGHREEPRIVADLRAIGCEVWDVDADTGQQFEYTAVSGHVVVKLDAVLLGLPESPKTPHVGEFKTHNAKSFAQVSRKGLRAGKPEHFAQLLLGMVLAGLTRGLYLAVNKDNDEIYVERIRLNEVQKESAALLAFAESVIRADRAPERISDDRDSLHCRFCPHNAVCHGTESPTPAIVARISCRSCCHSTAVIEPDGIGRWSCSRHGKTLGEADQVRACEDHLFIPDFITFAEMVDAADESDAAWIEYRNPDGTNWKNSKRPGDFKSIELTVLPSPLVGAAKLEDEVAATLHGIKKRFGAEVVEVSGV